jgi:hypothetical protein
MRTPDWFWKAQFTLSSRLWVRNKHPDTRLWLLALRSRRLEFIALLPADKL